MRWLTWHLSILFRGLLGLGFVLQVGWQDQIHGIAFLYYAYSVMMLFWVSLLSMFFWWCTQSWASLCWAKILFLLSSAVLVFAGQGTLSRPGPVDQRILFANIQNGSDGYASIFDELQRHQADMTLVVELGDRSDFLREADKRSIPCLIFPGGLAVLGRKRDDQRIKVHCFDEVPGQWRFAIFSWGERRILIADIMPSPFNDRGAAFHTLSSLIDRYEPDVIAGDFNTPYHSTFFDDIRLRYECGLTDKQMGRESWPQPLPLYSIDHVFLHKQWRQSIYRMVPNSVSDHCFVLMECDLNR